MLICIRGANNTRERPKFADKRPKRTGPPGAQSQGRGGAQKTKTFGKAQQGKKTGEPKKPMRSEEGAGEELISDNESGARSVQHSCLS